MLTQLVVWLNQIAGVIASVLLAPIAWLPGWLSATVVASVTGIMMLTVFKFTSAQTAIRQTRNQIKANLLALSLFKDSLWVGLSAQCAILWAAGRLFALSLVPMLAMSVPTCLLLGQLALWFQARPLSIGEEAVVTVHMAEGAEQLLREIQLVPSAAATVTAGPVRVPAKNMVCWNIQAHEPGLHVLSFAIGTQQVAKELAVGQDYMMVSLQRPSWNWSAALLNPREQPFANDSAVQSIEVAYPQRSSWTTGTDSWLIYWFLVSMTAAFIVRPLLKVSI